MPHDAPLPPFESTSSPFTFTQAPNPGWKYGEGVASTEEGRAWLEGEKEGWRVIDTADPGSHRLYPIFISGIVPRPVAFVSTVSKDGVENLAPFSWFNQASLSGVMFVETRPNQSGGIPPNHDAIRTLIPTLAGPKDTTRNIRETKSFVVNIISEPWVQQANAASIDAPSDVSEWEITALTKAETVFSKAPRVRESAFAMECELFQDIDIKDPNTGNTAATLIIGFVKYIHIRNDVVDPERGTVDIAKFKPVARLGGVAYGRIQEGYVIPREQWAVKGEEIKDAVGLNSHGPKEEGSEGETKAKV